MLPLDAEGILRALIRADDKMTYAGASDGAAWRLVGEIELLSDQARKLLGLPPVHTD
jgi:hypothetical protein